MKIEFQTHLNPLIKRWQLLVSINGNLFHYEGRSFSSKEDAESFINFEIPKPELVFDLESFKAEQEVEKQSAEVLKSKLKEKLKCP